MKPILAATVLAATLAKVPGCYGHYGAFKKVNDWNGTVTNNMLANSAVHLALWIVPVYELVLAGDFLIFNTIEALTGKNPFIR